MKQPTKVRKVEAWGIFCPHEIPKGGLVANSGYGRYFIFHALEEVERNVKCDACKIIPLTISYTLPTANKKGR